MGIPGFQEIMLPLLEFAQDGNEHSVREAYDYISDVFELTDAERNELLRSGQQPVIENRVGWARTYMTKAGLLESARRGHFRITEVGEQTLARSPARIDIAFLRMFPPFVEFIGKRGAGAGQRTPTEDEPASQTPQDLIELGYESIRGDLAEQLLATVRAASPGFFERLVIELLLRMGYGGSRLDAGEAIGRSGDGGIDGIIKEDRLGLDVIYIQAKRWSNTVGAKEVRDFVGSLVGHSASKGVFITTSDYSADARNYIKTIGHKVILIDGERLAGLMIDHDVGVATVSTYDVKRLDADYFIED
jgi:restriction system protein